MRHQASWTSARREKFLEHLAISANVSASAAAARMSVRSAYYLREADLEFAQAWDVSLNIALDDLEQVLISRAKNGVTQPHVVRGKEVGMITTYSDALAMFILRSRRPNVYGNVRSLKAVKDVASKRDEDPLGALEAKLQAMQERLEDKSQAASS